MVSLAARLCVRSIRCTARCGSFRALIIVRLRRSDSGCSATLAVRSVSCDRWDRAAQSRRRPAIVTHFLAPPPDGRPAGSDASVACAAPPCFTLGWPRYPPRRCGRSRTAVARAWLGIIERRSSPLAAMSTERGSRPRVAGLCGPRIRYLVAARTRANARCRFIPFASRSWHRGMRICARPQPLVIACPQTASVGAVSRRWLSNSAACSADGLTEDAVRLRGELDGCGERGGAMIRALRPTSSDGRVRPVAHMGVRCASPPALGRRVAGSEA